jgi:hypothetical protein
MLHLQVSSQQGTFTSYLQEAPTSYGNCEQCICDIFLKKKTHIWLFAYKKQLLYVSLKDYKIIDFSR